nr:TetR family transcriptional regulator [Naumannella cuiyingiana]
MLDAVEKLINAHGVQAVGMDRVRAASGLSLKRIYGLYPNKQRLVAATLARRDERWREELAGAVDDAPDKVEALFGWLGAWFAEPDFRGCLWVNVHGELGGDHPEVLAQVRAHKVAFRDQVLGWFADAGPEIAEEIWLLAEGAIVTAGITGDVGAASRAGRAARRLLGGEAAPRRPRSP